MTDTSPIPADQLRAAAGHAPSPELARLLATLADASDHHPTGEGGAVATVVHPALAVARQLLGTSAGEGDRRCVCGDPIEWMSHPDGSGWIHSPGSDTRCLDARPVAAPPAPADRDVVLREAADHLDADMERFFAEWPDEPRNSPYANGRKDAANDLRRLADDAAAGVQPPTTSEAQPARRRLTPREHDRAWHAVEGSAGEPGADPGTVLNAVLHALRIDAPTAAEEQAASPSRRATPPAAPAAPEEPTWAGATELASDREIVTAAATGVVGYRQNQGRLLHCLAHKPAPASRWADFHEVGVDDLDDGGICVHPDCGRDLLAAWPTTRAPEEPTR
ncbi:hypothetical protein [Streptomyces griseus]|uniref:hypothetical protein n=1 Tax=Streptomyces griseus TaxID=1911 RepID=UPI003647D9BB